MERVLRGGGTPTRRGGGVCRGGVGVVCCGTAEMGRRAEGEGRE